MARRDKAEEREIARERVAKLAALADAAALRGRRDLADRYAELAWRLKTTYQLRPAGIEHRICRSCHAWLSGTAARVRLTGGRRTLTCTACGHVRRLGLPKHS